MSCGISFLHVEDVRLHLSLTCRPSIEGHCALRSAPKSPGTIANHSSRRFPSAAVKGNHGCLSQEQYMLANGGGNNNKGNNHGGNGGHGGWDDSSYHDEDDDRSIPSVVRYRLLMVAMDAFNAAADCLHISTSQLNEYASLLLRGLVLGGLFHKASDCSPAIAKGIHVGRQLTETLNNKAETTSGDSAAQETGDSAGPAVHKSEERDKAPAAENDEGDAIWEVRGNRHRKYIADVHSCALVAVEEPSPAAAEASDFKPSPDLSSEAGNEQVGGGTKPDRYSQVKRQLSAVRDRLHVLEDVLKQIFLPKGFPGSVSPDYLDYTTWKLAQVVVSETMTVLTTQSMLYAVGLGRGAIPTAAAINWVLKDGIGYLSKIALSQYGPHFDVSPKGWRLLADVAENASCGLQLLTATFPNLFVLLASMAGAGLSAAGLIQAATKSCFFAGFAAQRNYAELIAKGEAQGMAGKSAGIALGIFLSSRVGPTGPLLGVAYLALSLCHLYFNLRSYQAVQLKTLNLYRASLVFGEFLQSGRIPSVAEVNSEEPIFSNVSFLKLSRKRKQDGKMLSKGTKAVALKLNSWIHLGVPLGQVVTTGEELRALMALYSDEKYLLSGNNGQAQIVLKSGATSRDMLRAVLQAIHLCFVQREVSVVKGTVLQECKKGGALRVSRDFVQINFDDICDVLSSRGWIADGLIARPGPSRLNT